MATQALRRVARRAYLRMSISLFGNHVGIWVNLLYTAYAGVFRVLSALRGISNSEVQPVVKRATETFRAQGFVPIAPFLPRELLTQLRNKVDRFFANPEKVVHTLQDGGLIRLKDCLLELPELEAFLRAPEVVNVLRSYYGGEFKLFNADVYRTIAADADRPEDSFPSLLWHFDNLPGAMVKLMVYLRDTTRETGALTLIPKGKSASLRKRGFWDRRDMDRFIREMDESVVRIEGEAGTVVIFSTHFCIHKATLPERGYRDVAAFLVLPALTAERPWDEASKKAFSYNFGCCVNPFTSKPASFGEERA